jgi:hypothetical protein
MKPFVPVFGAMAITASLMGRTLTSGGCKDSPRGSTTIAKELKFTETALDLKRGDEVTFKTAGGSVKVTGFNAPGYSGKALTITFGDTWVKVAADAATPVGGFQFDALGSEDGKTRARFKVKVIAP